MWAVTFGLIACIMAVGWFVQYKVSKILYENLFMAELHRDWYLWIIKGLKPELFKPKYENNIIPFRKDK